LKFNKIGNIDKYIFERAEISYSYDEKGNCTKRYEYAEKIDLRMNYPSDWLKNLNGKKLVLVTTRDIQYY